MTTNNSWNSQDPVQVAKGGTGVNTTTAYGVLAGGTTATGAFQNCGAGTAGQVLTSNGAGALPSFQPAGGGGSGFTSIVTQVFTTSGTYTPTPNLSYAIIEVCGGGGGSGGTINTSGGGYASTAGGGGGGGYARKTVTAATIGVSQVVTVGAGGTAGVANGANGGNGGTSSVGAIISATGGAGSVTAGQYGVPAAGGDGGAGGVGSGGDFNVTGGDGFVGLPLYQDPGRPIGGMGGSSYFAGNKKASTAQSAGQNGYLYGGGASGGSNSQATAGQNGAAGADGIVIITEYIA